MSAAPQPQDRYIHPKDVEFTVEEKSSGWKDFYFDRQGRRWHLIHISFGEQMKTLLTPDDDEVKYPWPHSQIRSFDGIEIDPANACHIIDMVYIGFHYGLIKGRSEQAEIIRAALHP